MQSDYKIHKKHNRNLAREQAHGKFEASTPLPIIQANFHRAPPNLSKVSTKLHLRFQHSLQAPARNESKHYHSDLLNLVVVSLGGNSVVSTYSRVRLNRIEMWQSGSVFANTTNPIGVSWLHRTGDTHQIHTLQEASTSVSPGHLASSPPRLSLARGWGDFITEDLPLFHLTTLPGTVIDIWCDAISNSSPPTVLSNFERQVVGTIGFPSLDRAHSVRVDRKSVLLPVDRLHFSSIFS